MTREDARLQEYLQKLRSEVIDACALEADESGDGATPGFRENAFTQIALDVLTDTGGIEDGEVCFLERLVGNGYVKVNGYHVEEEDARLDLLTCVYRDDPEVTSVTKTVLTATIKRACRVFVEASKGYHEKMEPASDAFSMMQRIAEVAEEIERVRVIVVTDGIAANAGELSPDILERDFRLEIWDLRRLFRASSSGLPYEPITIDLLERHGRALPCLPMPPCVSDYMVHLAIFPGQLLADIYHEHGERLLELNVRSFLQARGKANKGIRDTLRDAPARFLAYNNGISATAENVQIKATGGGIHISSMTGFQIVNGGQTVASIHRAAYSEKRDLSDVYVQAKITIVTPQQIETLVPLISRYANTQNPVNEADFSANDPFHVKIQQLSERIWAPGEQSRWFYERARGQFQVAKSREATTPARRRRFNATTPTKQKFDKVLLAKYLNAWQQKPHIVGRGGQKNFVQLMTEIKKARGSNWEPDEEFYRQLIACAIIYKQADRSARQHGFPAYRANAIAYTVSLVSYKTVGRVDLDAIWDQQAVSDALADTIHEWMPVIYDEILESAQGRNVTEWCKKEECWRQIQTLYLSVPDTLEEELAEGQPIPTVGWSARHGEVRLTTSDRENLARVMQVSADEWLEICGWGTRTGNLKPWQSGIAGTLAVYAKQRWSSVPSHKQARQAVKILCVAEESGVRYGEDKDT